MAARRQGKFSKETVRRVSAYLDSRDPRSLWAVSDAKDGEKSIGKYLLLGGSWHGDIDMNENSETMRRCLGYIALRR